MMKGKELVWYHPERDRIAQSEFFWDQVMFSMRLIFYIDDDLLGQMRVNEAYYCSSPQHYGWEFIGEL